MKANKILIVAAIIAAMAFTGCEKDENTAPENPPATSIPDYSGGQAPPQAPPPPHP